MVLKLTRLMSPRYTLIHQNHLFANQFGKHKEALPWIEQYCSYYGYCIDALDNFKSPSYDLHTLIRRTTTSI